MVGGNHKPSWPGEGMVLRTRRGTMDCPMKTPTTIRRRNTARMGTGRRQEAGMSLLELMIAMFVLAIGLGGLSGLFLLASQTNTKNSKATSSTMLAQQVLEQ